MAVEKNRWAVIAKESGEVSDIKIMEGGAKPQITHEDKFDVIQVDGDVKIGMVRKGGSFAFAEPARQAEAEAEQKDPEGDGDKADSKSAGDVKKEPAKTEQKPAPEASKTTAQPAATHKAADTHKSAEAGKVGHKA